MFICIARIERSILTLCINQEKIAKKLAATLTPFPAKLPNKLRITLFNCKAFMSNLAGKS